jgi:hypothetical protein
MSASRAGTVARIVEAGDRDRRIRGILGARRGVAQPGSARRSGRRGPRFESGRPDWFMFCEGQRTWAKAPENIGAGGSRFARVRGCSVVSRLRDVCSDGQNVCRTFAGPGAGNPSARRAILRLMADFSDVVLESVGVQSYADLVALGPEDILRLPDDKKPPLQPSDAFLAVMVVSAVSELQATTRALDSAKRGFERATIVLAALSVILTAAGVIVALTTLVT